MTGCFYSWMRPFEADCVFLRVQAEKLESSAQTLAESQTDIEARKAELKAVSKELASLEKIKGKTLASMQLKVECQLLADAMHLCPPSPDL